MDDNDIKEFSPSQTKNEILLLLNPPVPAASLLEEQLLHLVQSTCRFVSSNNIQDISEMDDKNILIEQ